MFWMKAYFLLTFVQIMIYRMLTKEIKNYYHYNILQKLFFVNLFLTNK